MRSAIADAIEAMPFVTSTMRMKMRRDRFWSIFGVHSFELEPYECDHPMSIHDRELRDTVLAERAKKQRQKEHREPTQYTTCIYCGKHVSVGLLACPAHDDLIELDPEVVGDTPDTRPVLHRSKSAPVSAAAISPSKEKGS